MKTAEIETRAAAAGVVPVLTINDPAQAVPLAEALVAGGLDVLEVTLRTAGAIEAIENIAKSDIDCVLGAGTIISEGDIDAAHKAGAKFLVTPGTPESLLPALLDYDGLVFPGVATVSEAMTLYNAGFDLLKFFPAEASGGAKFLKGIFGPLPHIRFMPTGGVNLENMSDYLALDNIVAIGGTWIAPASSVDAGEWAAITQRAQHAKDRAIKARS